MQEKASGLKTSKIELSTIWRSISICLGANKTIAMPEPESLNYNRARGCDESASRLFPRAAGKTAFAAPIP